MCDDTHCNHKTVLNRRGFVSLLSMGAVATLATPVLANGKAKALMLSCMDYRLDDDVVQFMNRLGLNGEYDHLVLAGASLGVVANDVPSWHKAFWDQLGLAVDLHGVEEVIIVDHRDCGAYKLMKGLESVSTPELEMATHTEVVGEFAVQLREKFPELKLSAYLMGLDGQAEEITIAAA
jgi:carbonic anhydrase